MLNDRRRLSMLLQPRGDLVSGGIRGQQQIARTSNENDLRPRILNRNAGARDVLGEGLQALLEGWSINLWAADCRPDPWIINNARQGAPLPCEGRARRPVDTIDPWAEVLPDDMRRTDGDRNVDASIPRSGQQRRFGPPRCPQDSDPVAAFRPQPVDTLQEDLQRNVIPGACPSPPHQRCARATAPRSANRRARSKSTRPLEPVRIKTPRPDALPGIAKAP